MIQYGVCLPFCHALLALYFWVFWTSATEGAVGNSSWSLPYKVLIDEWRYMVKFPGLLPTLLDTASPDYHQDDISYLRCWHCAALSCGANWMQDYSASLLSIRKSVDYHVAMISNSIKSDTLSLWKVWARNVSGCTKLPYTLICSHSLNHIHPYQS